jgi:hypothetical protein
LSGIIVGSILTFLIRIKRQRKDKLFKLETVPEKNTDTQ